MRYFIVGYTAIKNNNELFAAIKGVEVTHMPTYRAVIDFIEETKPGLNKIALISLTELSEEDYNTFCSDI
jgi:hypothetical protein